MTKKLNPKVKKHIDKLVSKKYVDEIKAPEQKGNLLEGVISATLVVIFIIRT